MAKNRMDGGGFVGKLWSNMMSETLRGGLRILTLAVCRKVSQPIGAVPYEWTS